MLSSVERFDPQHQVWEQIPPMQTARVAVAAAAVDRRLCVAGGNNDHAVHASVERFDPEANVWSSVPAMRCPRWAAAAASIGRQLYVIGGRDADDEVLNSVECFLSKDGVWTS